MKRICTLLMTSCALMFAQALHAQSVTASTTAPIPLPNFGATLPVQESAGFTSTNTNSGKFQEFAKGQTITITSPFLQYLAIPSKIYFVYRLTINNGNGSASAPSATVSVTDGPSNINVTPSLSLAPGGGYYYFTLDFGSSLPTTNTFRVSLTMTLTNQDATITAVDFQSDALSIGNATLPVNFSNFFAQKASDGVALAWNVGQEQNVSNYQVDRSTDGVHFTAIGSVAASGHPSYSFIDRQPVTPAYYRIKANDKDGKYKYSSVVSIKGLQSTTIMKAFPSPVQSQLTVQHSAAQAGSSVQVFSVDGRMIRSIMPATGSQQTSVDLSTGNAGVYIVKFVNGSEVASLKIVKQ